MHNLFGFDVHVSPDYNKYTLPEEVIPGVPWPAGFREEINAWSRNFIGTYNLVKDNEFLQVGTGYNKYILCNPRSYNKLKIAVNNINI